MPVTTITSATQAKHATANRRHAVAALETVASYASPKKWKMAIGNVETNGPKRRFLAGLPYQRIWNSTTAGPRRAAAGGDKVDSQVSKLE